MQYKTLFIAIAALVTIGCGKEGSKTASSTASASSNASSSGTQNTRSSSSASGTKAGIDAVGQAFASAKSAKDEAALKSLFPSDELFESYLTCPTDKGPYAGLRKSRATGGRKGKFDGDKLTFKSTKAVPEKTRDFKAGDKLDKCKVLKDFTFSQADLVFDLEKEGQTKEVSEGSYFVQFDGKWYLLAM